MAEGQSRLRLVRAATGEQQANQIEWPGALATHAMKMEADRVEQRRGTCYKGPIFSICVTLGSGLL